MLTELKNIKIQLKGDHLEIFQDDLMVAKRESIKSILNDGEVEDFYANWVYHLAPDAKEKIGEIIIGLMNGDYAKVE